MGNISFTKMHGLGNSHIYIDALQYSLPEQSYPKLAKVISCSHIGIGADGLIVIAPSSKADIKMLIYNKDGSEAKNCGNGLRCVAKYAYEQGMVASKTMKIETLGGIVEATLLDHQGTMAIVSVNMGKPQLKRQAIPMKGDDVECVVAEPFKIEEHHLLLTTVSMGNPHAVFFVSDIAEKQHLIIGPKIEKDNRFPAGTNVEFVAQKSPSSFQMRVWERGAGATQACGTGACAAVVASVLNGIIQRDQEVTVQLEGGDLLVQWSSHGDVYMTGPATTIATGSFIWSLE